MADGANDGATIDDEPTVRVEFEVTAEEFATFVKWQLARMRALRWMAAMIVSEIVAGVLLIAVPRVHVVGVVVLIAGVISLLSSAWGLRRAFRRAWSKRSADMGNKQSLTFSASGVRVQTVNADTTAKWALYGVTVERGDLYFLGIKGGPFYRIIPKRAFASTGDEDEFRRLVRARTEAKLSDER